MGKFMKVPVEQEKGSRSRRQSITSSLFNRFEWFKF